MHTNYLFHITADIPQSNKTAWQN